MPEDLSSIRNGVDLVEIDRFNATFTKEREYFERSVFTEKEMRSFKNKEKDISHLAGLFAAKEAVIKCWRVGGGRWREVVIAHTEEGAPYIEHCAFSAESWEGSLSISHDGNYAAAFAVFIRRK